MSRCTSSLYPSVKCFTVLCTSHTAIAVDAVGEKWHVDVQITPSALFITHYHSLYTTQHTSVTQLTSPPFHIPSPHVCT